MRGDAYDTSELRTAGDAAVIVACGAGVVVLAAAGWALLRSEPAAFLTRLLTYGLLAAGGFALVGAAVAGVRARRMVAVIVASAALVVSIAAVGLAPWLHWRLSRAAFDRVAAGEAVACEDGSPCRLGWWNVERSEHRDGLAFVWTTRRGFECSGGYALVRATASSDATHEALGATVLDETVTPFRDGWYELCVNAS